jgi:DNA-binding CsgD family transcriptional regulator
MIDDEASVGASFDAVFQRQGPQNCADRDFRKPPFISRSEPDCLQVPVENDVHWSLTENVQSGNVDAMDLGTNGRTPDQHRRHTTNRGGNEMKEQTVRLGPREQQIVELLLQGCDNAEIASQLKMARRTVKAHFNRLFLRFGITGGIKRVKLATLLYRRQACLQLDAMGTVSQVNVNTVSSSSLPKA